MRTWRTPAERKGVSHLGLQEAQQAMREERRLAAFLFQRIANPEMRRAFEHARARVVARLLQRLEESFGLRAAVDDVVGRTPRDKECSAVIPGGDMGERRSVEVDAPVVDQARAEEAFDDVIARSG